MMKLEEALSKIPVYGRKIYALSEDDMAVGPSRVVERVAEGMSKIAHDDEGKTMAMEIGNTLTGVRSLMSLGGLFTETAREIRKVVGMVEELVEKSFHLKKIKSRLRGSEEEKSVLLFSYLMGAVSAEDILRKGEFTKSDEARLKNVAVSFDLPGVDGGRRDGDPLIPKSWTESDKEKISTNSPSMDK